MEEETFHIQEMGSRYPKACDAGWWLWDSGIRMYFSGGGYIIFRRKFGESSMNLDICRRDPVFRCPLIG
jgi:hypothetical protein